MENYVLCAVLILLLLLYLKINKWDFASPNVLFCAGFVVSSFFFAINTNNWNYTISYKTIGFILFGILFFDFGCRVGNRILVRTGNVNKSKGVYVNQKTLNAIVFSVIIVCFLVRIYDIKQITGSISLLSGALGMYRNSALTRMSNVIKICDALVSTIMIFESLLLIKKVFTKEKGISFPIIMLVLGMIYYVMSSSRIELIYVFTYLLVAYFFELKLQNIKVNFKVIKYVLISGFLLVVIFFGAGYLTGKSQVQVSVFDNISLYAGSSIGAFDIWVEKFQYSGQYFGSIIFYGISNILSLFGIHTSIISDPSITYINIGNMLHTTNVYTCLGELFSDVGIVGAYVILVLEGLISQVIYKKAKKTKSEGNNFYFCVYLYLSPIILLSSIAERYFTTFFTLSTIVFIFCISLLLNIQQDH